MSAEEFAAAWGASGAHPVSERENAIYRVRLGDGRAAALRLHRPGYQSDEAIRSELWWMERLAERGLMVPNPVRTGDGDLLVRREGRVASLVTWLPGDPLGSGDTGLPSDPDEVARCFRSVGATIAAMHDATDDLEFPTGFERPAWDAEGLLGEAPLWGRFWENPSLTRPESARLAAARTRVRARLEAEIARGADFGLIHADLLRENILVDGDQVALIDFDDAGFGFRAYDLATAEVQGFEDPMNPVVSRALLEGYSAMRRKDAPRLGDVPLFVALRCFASAGWASTRLSEGDPRQRFYAERALRAAETLTGT